jgi:hypothetical protein
MQTLASGRLTLEHSKNLSKHLGPVLTVEAPASSFDLKECQQHGSFNAEHARSIADIALCQATSSPHEVHGSSPIDVLERKDG